MTISIIAALGKNRVIGKGNSLPWYLPADLKHFKDLTIGKTLIMGSKTFDSIGGKPFEGRKFIILDSDKEKEYKMERCKTAHSIEEAIKLTEGEKEIIVAGGASIYKQFLPLANKMYLTLIDGDFEGDIYFPEYNQKEWKETGRVEVEKDKDNPYSCSFIILEK